MQECPAVFLRKAENWFTRYDIAETSEVESTPSKIIVLFHKRKKKSFAISSLQL